MDNNNVLGNGVVSHEFSQRHGIERLADRLKKVGDVPPIECGNWLLHRHFIRHEYKICKNVISRELINSYGHNEYANCVKGLVLRREGRIQESLNCFRDSCIINCTNVHHVKQIAKSLYLLGDHKRAIDTYSEAEKMANLPDWEIHHRFGECYVALHCLQEAMREFLKASELTKNKIAHIALARLAISEGNIDHAIEVYNRIIQCSSDSNDAAIELGFVYLQHDNIPRAFQAFGTVLAQSPTCIGAILPMAYIIQNHREYDVALSKYKSAASSYPESWQLWNNIGMCFCGKQKFVAAITCLKRANYLNPMAWQPACNLGRVFLLTGQPASAAIHLCAAIAAATPQNPMPLLLLGLALKKLEDIEGAERALSKAHSLTPHDPIVLVNYAIILERQSKCARAAEILSDFNAACAVIDVELPVLQAAKHISHKIESSC